MSGRQKVMVVGAGGHARVVESLLRYVPDVELAGFADRTRASFGERIGGAAVTTTWDELPAWRDAGVTAVALAIGDNAERARMFAAATAHGYRVLGLRHPTAFVERDAVVGEAAVICAGAILGAGCRLGANTLVNTGAIVDHECAVGDHAHLGPGCRLAGRVTVGALTFVGLGATVREGIRIGENVVVGMGSVVVADIPDNAVAYGVPSRVRAATDRSDA